MPEPDPPSMQHLSGWLYRKKPGMFAGWTKSWWVLDFPTQSICEYKSPTTSDGSPIFEVDAFQIRKVVKKDRELFTIQVVGEKDLTLKAEDESSRNRWLEVFGEFLLSLPEQKGGQAGQAPPVSNHSMLLSTASSSRLLPQTRPGSVADGLLNTSGLSVSVDNPDQAGSGRLSVRSPVIQDQALKKNAAIMETGVFMGKARNFAVSTNKDFAESAKKKGTLNLSSGKERELNEEEAESNSVNKRAAVLPVMTPEEQISPDRFIKTAEQNTKLVEIVSHTLANFFGGNLFAEVEPQAIVDLMFQVKGIKGENVVTQGEPTDRMFVIEKGSVGVYTQDFVDRPPELEHIKTVGDLFGVLSLLYNQPGPFTITAHTENLVLWAITRRKFHELTTNQTKRRVAKKVRLLEGVPLIADNLEQNLIVQLADSMEYVELEHGQTVVKRGEALTKVYIIGEGTAELTEIEGQVTPTPLGRGDAFGEWSLLDFQAKADATMTATSALTILTLDVKEVEEIVGPLRGFVLRKWAEAKGEFFFLKDGVTQMRGGTVFKEDTDIRNPMSRAQQTVQFNSAPSTSVEEGNAVVEDMSIVKTDAILASLNKEQEDAAIAEALQFAKQRSTKVGSSAKKGKTISKKAPAPAPEPPTVVVAAAAAAAVKEAEPAAAPAESVVTEPVAVVAPEPAVVVVANAPVPIEPESEEEEEEEDDEAAIRDEEALDKPFDFAPPLRPELKLQSIKLCALLGRGNFGRVHLARNEANHKELFALKVLGRHFIVQNGWEILVENERNAMLELAGLTKSPFLIMLYNSFSDKKNIYLLLELCEGGDLYNLLRITKTNRFSETVAQFYMACVVLGLEAMHSREICYRDLKPENLMISRNGYVKVADFGLAKKTLRTFTVCGTPDYMAPEVILSRGHGMPVDWWAIGVLLYEMLTAITPFFGNEAMEIYENVLAHETVDDIEFPPDVAIGEPAMDLMRELMHPKKNKRLGIRFPGVKGIKAHAFFVGFDWQSMYTMTQKPPMMPTIVDMSKFGRGTEPTCFHSHSNEQTRVSSERSSRRRERLTGIAFRSKRAQAIKPATNKRLKPEAKEAEEEEREVAVASNEPKQQVIILKQRFNALHELRYTEPESQFQTLMESTTKLAQAHREHVLALEHKHENELEELQRRFTAELNAERERTRMMLATAPQPLLAQDATSAQAVAGILDCFKLLTAMHVSLDNDEAGTGTCTIFHPQTKRGVKFLFEITQDKVEFTPGANCKKLLPTELAQKHTLDKTKVPMFICAVQRELFNIH
ncbi:hypothetical protein BASA81_006373 [Batrachochytrium salamandrivorans]|nr:hypothetical protein BASA81_006373 [Batrachochytrium salamandrivorans]